jgi:UDP-N-acetylmuramoyl-L-alanyl-D-glutamate--2,6-diaminopimelate ligase
VIAAEVADGNNVDVELDRRRAIERAIASANVGDVVVIAGKGHEQGQEFADRIVPFDDREVARDALRNLKTPA